MTGERESYKFPKSERLHLKSEIDALFQHGRWKHAKNIRMVYQRVDNSEGCVTKAMFSVSKRLFKRAVTRNLLKRRMREAYRLNKYPLINISKGHVQWNIAFIYNSTEVLSFGVIEKDIQKLLSSLK